MLHPSWPPFWECCPPVDFTHYKSQGEYYHELKHTRKTLVENFQYI
jgi:hypothetical protein